MSPALPTADVRSNCSGRLKLCHPQSPSGAQAQIRELPCSEFERLLVAMSFWLYQQRKRTKEPVEEFLGAFMDFVYRKSGALQAMPGDASNEAASTQILRP